MNSRSTDILQYSDFLNEWLDCDLKCSQNLNECSSNVRTSCPQKMLTESSMRPGQVRWFSVCWEWGVWERVEDLLLRCFNLSDFIQQVFIDGLPCAMLMPDWPWKREEGVALVLRLGQHGRVYTQNDNKKWGGDGRGQGQAGEVYAEVLNGCCWVRQAGRIFHEPKMCALKSEIVQF